VKSTIALSDYVHSTNYTPNKTIESKLSAGLEYILNQQLFLRQSSNKPITTYINKLTYPFSYKSNVIELLRLMAGNGCLNDMRCKAAKELIQKKRKKNGVWQANYLVQPKHWINFDATKEPALWLMFQIKKLGLG
jgi:hypothetical protein